MDHNTSERQAAVGTGLCNMSRFFLKYWALGLVGVAGFAAAAEPQYMTWPSDVPGVELDATFSLTQLKDASGRAIDWVDGLVLHIRDRRQAHSVSSDLAGPWPDAGMKLRIQQSVRWRDPYLIVERYCAGNAWGSGGITVFRVQRGMAQRLGELGGEVGDKTAGINGRFREVYDRFEGGIPGTKPSLSHAGSPGLIVFLRTNANGFAVDRDATCRKQANPLPALGEAPVETGYGADIEPYLSRIAVTALIQRYCNRKADFRRTLAVAERTLSAQNYKALKAAMDQVTPFEAPFESRKPWKSRS